jgi:cytochrome c oxidase cbb3-type subunit 3
VVADAQAESEERSASDVGIFAGGGGSASALLHVPVVTLYPGDVPVRPTVKSPVADDPAAAQRGMEYFIQMNCVGCHAPNGAGGMGPALSNAKFVYGSEPENIYLSILQGRPNGMPAWGGMLPDQVIWDLVAYIQSISKEPAGSWGKTTSTDDFTIEQVPSEFITTTTPWDYTTPFSYGQAPFEKPKGSPPLEAPK